MSRPISDRPRGGFLGFAAAALVAILGVQPAAAQAPAPGTADYRLAPGDTLDFDILNDIEPPVRVTVGAEGRVLVPLVGDVAVGGLTIAEAREALGAAYRAGEFLVEPKVGLSLAEFGDIYVIGDVRNPGVFPFRLKLNVEQAVALAGGYSTILTAEGGVLQIAGLQHDLAEANAEILRQAVWAARLDAQIAGRRTISDNDIPPAARPFLDPLLLPALKAGEERILGVLIESYEGQKAARAYAIKETENELKLLSQRLEKQDAAMTFTRRDLALERSLIEMRRRAPDQSSALERQLVNEEAIALGLLAQISQARTRVSTERSALAELDSQWLRGAWTDIQGRRVELGRLVSLHRSLSDQLALVTGLAAAGSEPSSQPIAVFKLRRNDSASSGLVSAGELTQLAPGDVLVVSVVSGATPGG